MDVLVGIAPPPLWTALGWVYAFIGGSTAVAYAIPKVRQSPAMLAPILGWWPVSLVGTLAVYFGKLPSAVVLAAISVGVFREALALVGLPPALHRVVTAIGVPLALVVHAGMLVDPSTATVLAFAVPMLAVPLAQLLVEGSTNFTRNVGGAQWVMLATIGLFSFGARLVIEDGRGPYGGQGAAFAFFVLVMLSDALQWIGGKLFGRTPLVPRVSPKKTWEGFLVGMGLCAAVGSFVGPAMLGLPPVLGAALGAGVVALGLFGDLIASGWKRDAGVKDSGAVIPGQGGLLDRCDSILFVAPWFYGFVALAVR